MGKFKTVFFTSIVLCNYVLCCNGLGKIPHNSPLKMGAYTKPFNTDIIKQSNIFTTERKNNLQLLDTIKPGTKAPQFSIWTLNHGKISYPSSDLPYGVPIGLHAFTNQSGFLECMWTNTPSLTEFVETSPENVNYVIMSFDNNALTIVQWMEKQLKVAVQASELSEKQQLQFLERLFFVITPVSEIGNWVASILRDWSCTGHGCGFDQVMFSSESWQPPIKISKRVDARYDWVFNHQWTPVSPLVSFALEPCLSNISNVNNTVAMTSDETSDCSIAQKVINLENAGAVGVLVYSKSGFPLQDLNCYDADCNHVVNIPVASIPYENDLLSTVKSLKNVSATLQTTSSSTFYFTIDSFGNVVEPGWFLFPSLKFLAWQMEWLVYYQSLMNKITSLNDYVVPVFNRSVMHGKDGTGNVTVFLEDLHNYEFLFLDASLSCPGDRDDTCPPWDHVATLHLCCEGSSQCGVEIGRWITPFRRRIGQWLTNISQLMPLFLPSNEKSKCSFMMKVDAWWAQPWLVSLILRFQKPALDSFSSSKYTQEIRAKPIPAFTPAISDQVIPLFNGGVFDKNYNTKYHPFQFKIPIGVTSVKIYAVITGHGSDDFGCGEFCVTSHHFVVDEIHNFTKVFTAAGTPQGCADRVSEGVVPNEHGTWLYGRDGWCDGQQVSPWISDISDVVLFGNINTLHSIKYFGLFNGKDPNPTKNPGLIRMVSFLIFGIL